MTDTGTADDLRRMLQSEGSAVDVRLAGPGDAMSKGRRLRRHRRLGALSSLLVCASMAALVLTRSYGSETSVATHPLETVPLDATDVISPLRAIRAANEGQLWNATKVACLRSRGWTQQDLPRVQSPDNFTLAEREAFASSSGFGRTTMATLPGSDEFVAVMDANNEVGLGADPATKDRFLADSLACGAQADAQQAEGGALLGELSAALGRVGADPQVIEATASWSQCMQDRGIESAGPEELERHYVDLMDAGSFDSEVRREEINAAVLTAECASTHLWPVTRAAELRELSEIGLSPPAG